MKLSSDQQQDLAEGQPVKVIVDGRNCVLLTRQAFERVKDRDYDDGRWTDEEMNLLATEAADLVAGDALDREDDS